MRILFVSDVMSWAGFKAVVNRVRPDVTLFGGDLVSDGHAAFWRNTPFSVPRFRSQLLRFLQSNRTSILRKTDSEDRAVFHTLRQLILGDHLEDTPVQASWFYAPDAISAMHILFRRREENHRVFHTFMNSVTEKYRATPEFHTSRLLGHVEKFYQALEDAANVCNRILVVSGNHDEYFKGDYDVERINRIANCREISGKIESHEGVVFLGLGFRETHYLRSLRPVVQIMEGQVDVILAHAEESRLPLIAGIDPVIIFRGHFGSGRSRIGGVPIVAAAFPSYVVAELTKKRIASIQVAK